MADRRASSTRHLYRAADGVAAALFRPLVRLQARAMLGWRGQGRVVLFAADPAEVRKRYDLAVAGVQGANRILGDVGLAVAHNVNPAEMPLYMNAADCLVLM